MVLHTYMPESFGGAERQCRKLGLALANEGVSVRILAPRLQRSTPADEQDGPLRIERLRVRNSPNLGGRHLVSFLVWSLRLIIRLSAARASVDVIHVFHGRLHAVPALLAGLISRRPVLIKIGRGGALFDLDVLAAKRGYGRIFARLLAQRSHGFISNSQEITADLERWGVEPGRIFSIPNGVEATGRREQSSSRPASQIRFGYLGRFDPEKGLDRLLRAFAKLPPRPRSQLVLVGEGVCERELRALADELRLGSRVTFMKKVDDVIPVLDRLDYYVSSSLSEGMSNAMLEAMSRGVPAIVSDVSGSAEVIEAGVSGWLFPSNEPQRLEAALKEAIRCSEVERAAMGEAARATIERRFDIRSVALQHLSLYGSIR